MEEGIKELQEKGTVLSKKEMAMLGILPNDEKKKLQDEICEKIRKKFNLPCLKKEALKARMNEIRKIVNKGVVKLYNKCVEDVKALARKNAEKIAAVDANKLRADARLIIKKQLKSEQIAKVKFVK